MDMELREILKRVYKQEMKPDEAQWKICVLFNSNYNDKMSYLNNNRVVVCQHEPDDKDVPFPICKHCGENINL